MTDSNFFPFERNRYFYGKLLTVRDFEMEQTYFQHKRQLINRVVHGAGVLCGLGTVASDETTIMIESGMALDYLGREIVLKEPVIRKLQMLDGYENLKDKTDAYLCLSYDEKNTEPVNAVGAEAGESSQFNVTRETCHLSLTTEPPEYRGLMEAMGRENVNVLYSSEELTLLLWAPTAICSGSEFQVSGLIIKTHKTPPVHFTLDGEASFINSSNGRLHLEYHQSSEETRNVIPVEYTFKAQELSDVSSALLPSGAELNIELGSHSYKNYISVDVTMHLCADETALNRYLRRIDALEQHWSTADTPIYLAKLELIQSSGGLFIADLTELPFGQTISSGKPVQTSSVGPMKVTTSVEAVDYWQKPAVRATAGTGGDSLHFDFKLPTPEQYDYSVSHGTVDIPMAGGLRVNARYYSDEIPHGLGPGAVTVQLAVEFVGENEETALLIGNSEVFRSKSISVKPPFVETAVLLYPERGTMRIGVWLQDSVEGNLLRVHYFAQSPQQDTSRILAQQAVKVSVLPEVSRVKCRKQLRLKASVTGSEDGAVLWSVQEQNGGTVDRNGVYQAPEVPGTYEIVARSRADETAKASAFVIVEE